ncbi:MAG TPA: prolyl oligopeptidase family serine peptidase [Candidatus Krumholzibacteria bacterium]|nr:prolyl oligopeptidase family serine peptidase [Candidatus Krumholzibacteria bacterium]
MPRFVLLLTLGALLVTTPALASDDDPYLWLEEVEGEKALEWVEERSAEDTAELEAIPEFDEIHQELLEIYNSQDRIPYVSIQGPWLYNFWRDAEHVRGVWRRTFLDSYLSDEPVWETVIDVDALAEEEGENWVWKGAQGLGPDYRRYLVNLSRGGGDATVVREFDAATRTWVEDGFQLPEAKSNVGWKDIDTVWVGTDFGEGSLTDSGYPRLVKLWERGTPLEEAELVYAGEQTDVSVGAFTNRTDQGDYDLVYQTPEFFRGTYRMLLDGHLVKLDIPSDAQPRGFFEGQMMLSLRSDWEVDGTTYPKGALLSIDLDAFLAGGRDFDVIFEPSERVSLSGVSNTRSRLLLVTLDNVRSRLYELTYDDGAWTRDEVELPGMGSVGLAATSDQHDHYFLTYTDPLTPSSLYLKRPGAEPEKVKSTPEYFDASGMDVVQYEAESADGTMIPYFVMTPKGFEADGQNPTLLYGYGGFEVSMLPRYSAATGKAWVERGGVYVIANIRGGGEFGPRWHQAALRENRQRAYDDFIAVAEDLIDRDITSREHLGIAGGSNGGLLVGAVMVQRPELFEAVVCQVPLLDMKRYHQLLAGASWMAEYGNPDTDDWKYMKEWSPYQNVEEDADYPRALFYTSTRDDRVHPGHARKMVKKMTDMGHDVLYYENTEGGHGMAANQNQRAYMWALTYAYLFDMLR